MVLLLSSMQSPGLAAILKGVQDTGPIDQDLSLLIGFGVGPYSFCQHGHCGSSITDVLN